MLTNEFDIYYLNTFQKLTFVKKQTAKKLTNVKVFSGFLTDFLLLGFGKFQKLSFVKFFSFFFLTNVNFSFLANC